MDNGLSASDVALLDGNNGFGGGNSFVWIFGLLILMGMFNGGFGNGWENNNLMFDRPATQSDIQNAVQFQGLQDGNRDIIGAIANGTAQSVQATNSAAFQAVDNVRQAQLQLQERLADLHTSVQAGIANQNQCCCDTKMLIQSTAANTDNMIQQNRYEAALNTAAINAASADNTQKILDAIQGNRISDLEAQVAQQSLALQMANVVRFPNAYTYNGGVFPPFTGCCGNNI